MGIEEFLPAILVIAVIYFTVKWLSGPSKLFHPCLLAFSRNADDVRSHDESRWFYTWCYTLYGTFFIQGRTRKNE
jgi:hypothetical protein